MNRNTSIQSNNSGRIDFEREDIKRLLRSLNLVSSLDLTRYNIRTLDDLRLLSKVKSKLLDYTRERPSVKLARGLDTWTEFKPYARRHYYAFKVYLREQHPPIDASNNMVYWAIKDLHRSRRDALLKERRRVAERKAREELENAEADISRPDGYTGYHPRRFRTHHST
ncbi:15_t:CDS:2 [Gigaspora margarita]|uniref:15_t:CDS:1 n=1 Tax=Gigaspora margarita TaxID=4874 RepID=A0ABN7UI09_GIGMA|nr:15_t:CDS:2 [Gigaspora margarita]